MKKAHKKINMFTNSNGMTTHMLQAVFSQIQRFSLNLAPSIPVNFVITRSDFHVAFASDIKVKESLSSRVAFTRIVSNPGKGKLVSKGTLNNPIGSSTTYHSDRASRCSLTLLVIYHSESLPSSFGDHSFGHFS